MRELVSLAIPLAAGLVLGGIFFGGLWWTVIHALSSRSPALWLLGSKLVRMGVVLGGFYLVGGGRWERWVSCLLGFVLARLLTWRLARLSAQTTPAAARAVRYAP